MRILTWNVNGFKPLIQYHPWNVLKTYEGIMTELEADIICLQETKITRAQMERSMACMDQFDCFYSFFRRTPPKGIHGTAIFTNRDGCIPLKAEEGLSSSLIPTSVLSSDRIGGYPSCVESDLEFSTMKDLDSEGRTTVCDFGMFVVINLYCPNLTNEERIPFKNNFNKMVDQRTRELIKLGRQVIVLGDLNICPEPIDAAEPDKRSAEQEKEEYFESAPRKWLKEFVGPNGPMIDICRKFHPTRSGMYTCWETKIDARTSNYGARIDFILITPGLEPWIKDSNILPNVVGSDHCPVFVDFHEEIEIEGRGLVKLWDEMNPGRTKGDDTILPPPFAARFYDEFSGKQKLLSNFFTKKDIATPSPPVSSTSKPTSTVELKPEETTTASTTASTSKIPLRPTPSTSTSSSTLAPRSSLFADYVSTASTSTIESKGRGKGKEVEKKGTILSFFPPPPPPPSTKSSKSKVIKKTKSTTSTSSSSSTKPRRSPSLPLPSTETITITDDDEDEDPAGEEEVEDFMSKMNTNDFEAYSSSADSGPSSSSANSTSAWSSIFAPKPVPNCIDHDEPAKLWTVKKAGINKGRTFYMCSRPVGEGYDKGQKGPVNLLYRCNFFEWDTNVKRPASLTPGNPKKKVKK